ncbi:RNA-guided endonuclease InsQ/TnpB family protein [Paraburkholderia humisilvae]|uniref:RNA-guided endonuclease InsQ/TnpB family protein n=1 Tax=Paraburkholderia humisilvae TaxID=627669 RepID=UPI001C2E7BDC
MGSQRPRKAPQRGRVGRSGTLGKGTADAPGRNVRAKSGLNRSILDQGWGEFRRQLEYRTAWRGGIFVAGDPKNTSGTCPCCGHVSKDNHKAQARFACVSCGHEADADHVGTLNVLAAGHATIACGGMAQSRRPAKQEPAEGACAPLSNPRPAFRAGRMSSSRLSIMKEDCGASGRR